VCTDNEPQKFSAGVISAAFVRGVMTSRSCSAGAGARRQFCLMTSRIMAFELTSITAESVFGPVGRPDVSWLAFFLNALVALCRLRQPCASRSHQCEEVPSPIGLTPEIVQVST
jgi:hypothetical protein